MEATYTPDGLILSQQRYILDLLQKSNMSEAKPVKTPMSTAHALSLLSGDPLNNPSLYRSLVGALQYLSLTRPDICCCKQSLLVHASTHFPPSPSRQTYSQVPQIYHFLWPTPLPLLIPHPPSLLQR